LATKSAAVAAMQQSTRKKGGLALLVVTAGGGSMSAHLVVDGPPGFLVLFLKCSENRTPVFCSILGTISVTSQIRDSCFYA
jgi:hypothetical protein